MTNNHYDVVVIGLGIMGAGALYQAAKRGAQVLGIDRFSPPHPYGSSHGDTRITRQAIGEGEVYMPFIRRSNEIWRELETITNRKLYLETGGLIIAPEGGGAQFHAYGNFVVRTAQIATTHGLDHEILNAEETMQRYPLLKLRSQDMAYYEPGAGVLRPELCIQTQLEQAVHYGATVHTHEIVTSYETTARSVRVRTNKATYEADRIVLATGAWLLDLLAPEYRPGVAVYRQVIYWFEADDLTAFTEQNFPFLIWIGDTMADYFSAFPTIRDGIPGVKVLTEQYARTTTPHTLDRTVKPEEIAHLYHMTTTRLHGVREELVQAEVCMYTVTPNEHFIIDFHPGSERVVIASPCSGHGFKHAAAVGETLAELALNGRSTLDISKFSLARLKTLEA
jgi:sarcosine oxidase